MLHVASYKSGNLYFKNKFLELQMVQFESFRHSLLRLCVDCFLSLDAYRGRRALPLSSACRKRQMIQVHELPHHAIKSMSSPAQPCDSIHEVPCRVIKSMRSLLGTSWI